MGAVAHAFSSDVRHIQVDDQGVVWIEGTAVKALEIVRDRQAQGWSPEEVHFQHPDLSLAQIYAALAWYHDHQAEMDAEIARRLAEVDAMKANAAPSALRMRLMATGRLK